MNKLYNDYIKIWENTNNSLDTIYNYIKQYKIDVDDYGNIIINNSKEESLPVFCCHLDTVFRDEPEIQLIKDDILISYTGVGGDDKCGIVACLELLKTIPCRVIMFRDEEKGCVGSKQFNNKILEKDKYIIEIDRKGNSDLIFNYCESSMASKEFIKDIKEIASKYDFKQNKGIYTDVCFLDKTNISRMNISAGYYNPHNTNEYVVLSDLQKTIYLCIDIANNLNKRYEFASNSKKLYDKLLF